MKAVEPIDVYFVRQDVALMKWYHHYIYDSIQKSNHLIVDISTSNTTVSVVRFIQNEFVINLYNPYQKDRVTLYMKCLKVQLKVV